MFSARFCLRSASFSSFFALASARFCAFFPLAAPLGVCALPDGEGDAAGDAAGDASRAAATGTSIAAEDDPPGAEDDAGAFPFPSGVARPFGIGDFPLPPLRRPPLPMAGSS